MKLRLLTLGFLLFLTACATGSSAVPQKSEPLAGQILYSNLDSEASRGEVEALLLDAGVLPERVQTVMAWVQDYNDCMRGCESFSLTGDFTVMTGGAVDYGEYPPMSRKWYKQNGRDYHDVLCRIVAFALAEPGITVKNRLPQAEWAYENGDTDWLYSDWSILRGRAETTETSAYRPNPLVSWDDEMLEKYFTLFAPVAISEGCSDKELLSSIQAEWDRRGISFAEGRMSLVTLWLTNGSQAAAGHAAILAETDEGFLLFEKTNPESPYSAAKFFSLAEVKMYLTEMLRLDDARYGIQREDPLILLGRDEI